MLEQALIEEEQKKHNIKKSQRITNFYDYNKQWQNTITLKRQQLKITLDQEEYQQKQQSIQITVRAKKDKHLPLDYVGPITGWKERVNEFEEKKIYALLLQENTFQPQLNKKSIEICMQNDTFLNEKVEERLIKYGNDIKNKKIYQKQQENLITEIEYQRQMVRPRTKSQSGDMIVHERLYRIAELQEKKKQMLIWEQSTSDLRPKINKLAPNKDASVNERRKQNPLHHRRTPTLNQEEKPEKILKSSDFEKFLQRNYGYYRDRLVTEHEEKVFDHDECTFKPSINEHSKQIMTDQRQTYLERNQQFIQNKENFNKLSKQEKEQNELNKCSFRPNLNIDIQKDKKIIQKQHKEEKKKKEEKFIKEREVRKVPHKQIITKSISPHRPQKNNDKIIQQPLDKSVNSKNDQQSKRDFLSYNLEDILNQSVPQRIMRDGAPVNLNEEFTKVEQELDDLFEQLNNKFQ